MQQYFTELQEFIDVRENPKQDILESLRILKDSEYLTTEALLSAITQMDLSSKHSAYEEAVSENAYGFRGAKDRLRNIRISRYKQLIGGDNFV